MTTPDPNPPNSNQLPVQRIPLKNGQTLRIDRPIWENYTAESAREQKWVLDEKETASGAGGWVPSIQMPQKSTRIFVRLTYQYKLTRLEASVLKWGDRTVSEC